MSSAWELRAVRAPSTCRPGGLDSARLQVRDVDARDASGSMMFTRSGRSLPRRCGSMPSARLLAALQAYREQRYGEFARLAGSHWARHPGIRPSAGKTGPRNCPRRRDPRGRDQPRLLPFRLIAAVR